MIIGNKIRVAHQDFTCDHPYSFSNASLIIRTSDSLTLHMKDIDTKDTPDS